MQLFFVHSPSSSQKGGVTFGSLALYWILRGQNPGSSHSICNSVNLGIKLAYSNSREDYSEEGLGSRIFPALDQAYVEIFRCMNVTWLIPLREEDAEWASKGRENASHGYSLVVQSWWYDLLWFFMLPHHMSLQKKFENWPNFPFDMKC
ncbi:hypothetical protein AV530_010575 [Patagioenas fasciata monilis]|uniref:Uncharacterized protein n=1 Tax=Patagioenas fasciata monilis TaxID=372326 RepID=A0A1V4KFN8_PATFA|nr:hypothetical protein AV530_010575 [Patagioenas fasciata monilis]